MNQLNYATLEASKRLVDAGIVLETETVWRKNRDLRVEPGYYLTRKALYHRKTDIPAPCMAEVWRELPSDDWELYQLIRKYLMFRGLDFEDYSVAMELIRIARSADALIDLLIWVRKEADHANA